MHVLVRVLFSTAVLKRGHLVGLLQDSSREQGACGYMPLPCPCCPQELCLPIRLDHLCQSIMAMMSYVHGLFRQSSDKVMADVLTVEMDKDLLLEKLCQNKGHSEL